MLKSLREQVAALEQELARKEAEVCMPNYCRTALVEGEVGLMFPNDIPVSAWTLEVLRSVRKRNNRTLELLKQDMNLEVPRAEQLAEDEHVSEREQHDVRSQVQDTARGLVSEGVQTEQDDTAGIQAELVVLRQHFESLQERLKSSNLSSLASPEKPFLGATSSPIHESEGVESIDLKKAERATYGGDPEEMETFLLQAIDEIKWRRKGGGGGAAEASVVSDTAAIRAEVLEIEVDNLTKEIVEERAIKAAAVHRCRIMYEDASRCAAEIGDLIQGFSIGLQSILSESEEDTSAVLKEHKKLLKQFHESEQVTYSVLRVPINALYDTEFIL